MFRQWLHQHQDLLYAWCLAQTTERLDADDFTAMAMSVQADQGAQGLTDWLLWAALMLARQRHGSPAGAPSTRRSRQLPLLPPPLQLLLKLAPAQALRSTDVLALLGQPIDQVHQQLEALWAQSCRQVA